MKRIALRSGGNVSATVACRSMMDDRRVRSGSLNLIPEPQGYGLLRPRLVRQDNTAVGPDGATVKKMGWEIEAALKAKIALEALREQAAVADLAQRYQVHPNQMYARKKQLQEHAARPFDAKVGQKVDARGVREIERLHAKIGQLTSKNDLFAKRFGR